MTRVYYVRHAQPNYNNHDDRTRELSEKGLSDRKKVTAFLQDKEITVAVSSPFKRAFDTIKDFADSVGLEIEVLEDFRERKIDSIWIEDFTAFSQKQWSDFSYKLSDGECLQEVQDRNITALKNLIDGKRIIEEQGGKDTAEYGQGLIQELSMQMTKDFGKGFTVTNLKYMQQFYLTFPNGHALRDELSWTHISFAGG